MRSSFSSAISIVLVLLAVFFVAGCPVDDSGESSRSDTDSALEGGDVGNDIVDEVASDVAADATPDAGEDEQEIQPDQGEDVLIDPVEEAAEEPSGDVIEETGDEETMEYSCDFPDGPYGFASVGNVVGPMTWPEAGVGELETLPADLWALHCDPDVHSIFIQVSTTTCSNCSTRLAQIKNLESHWMEHGAKWIFIVDGASSDASADSYIERKAIDFGWRTNDENNTWRSDAIVNSSIYSFVPWTGVIRASDMVLVYDEPDDRYLDIAAIATELDPDADSQ